MTRQDGPLWQIIALNSQAEYPGDEPFQIFCAFDPVSRLDLGRPSKTINGRAIYLFKKKSVRQIAVAGVFYKIFREMDLGDRDRPAKMTSYPIVLAWQMHAVGPQAGGQPVDTRTPIIFLVVLGLAVAYVFLRRATSRARSQTQPRRSYAPRRGSKPPAEDAPSQDSPRETTSGDNVDPLLREAAQQYRREKGLDDGQDRPGRTGPA